MSWWQVSRLSVIKAEKLAVVPPDSYGRVRSIIVRLAQQRHPETGKRNYWHTVYLIAIGWLGIGCSALICLAFELAWYYFYVLVLLLAIPLIYIVQGLLSIIVFRAGGWRQILEIKDLKAVQENKSYTIRR